MKQRVLTAIPLTGVAVLMVLVRGPVFYILLTLFTVVAQWEVYAAFRNASFRPTRWPGFLFALLFCPIYLLKGLNGLVSTFAIVCGILIASSLILSKKKFMDTVISVYALIYPCWFFIFILLLADMPYGAKSPDPYLANTFSKVGMSAAILAPCMSDMGAYLVGRKMGRHKLSPNVSPNKTIEGAIGGLIVAMTGMTIIGFLVNRYFYSGIHLWHYPVMGLLCGALGQAGDLTASALKRFSGIKDYSNILPGHGGIMDRMDSILFGTMGAYFYLSLFII